MACVSQSGYPMISLFVHETHPHNYVDARREFPCREGFGSIEPSSAVPAPDGCDSEK